MEMPALSVGETFMKPSPMLYRNLLAMETEELLRANPIDGVVLLGGCDKTIPGLLMGATSMNLPAIVVSAGPMLRGNWRGEVLGSGSDVWKFWAEKRAGRLDECAWNEMEEGIARSYGTWHDDGNRVHHARGRGKRGHDAPRCVLDPGGRFGHARMASDCGRRIVELVFEDLKPRDILTREAFENAVTVVMALGGSTNAIVHLIAMAGRAGVPLDLERFDSLSRRTPWLANLRPAGRYLMEDFYYAGGLARASWRVSPTCSTPPPPQSAAVRSGGARGCASPQRDGDRSREQPLAPEGGLAVLRGKPRA